MFRCEKRNKLKYTFYFPTSPPPIGREQKQRVRQAGGAALQALGTRSSVPAAVLRSPQPQPCASSADCCVEPHGSAATISARSACLHPPGSSMEWWHDSSPSCERVGSAKADGTAGRFIQFPSLQYITWSSEVCASRLSGVSERKTTPQKHKN